MSSDKQKRLMEMVIKEDELWMGLRDLHEEMRLFITTALTSQSDNKENMGMIMMCMKVCLSKAIIEEDLWEPKGYTFEEFLATVAPIIQNSPTPESDVVENVRKVIWGYIVFHLSFLLDMAEDYMKEFSSMDEIEDADKKSRVLYVCVFVAYIETMLRKIEFAGLELPGEY